MDARRASGETLCRFVGVTAVDAPSTLKLELMATWDQAVDNGVDAPSRQPFSMLAYRRDVAPDEKDSTFNDRPWTWNLGDDHPGGAYLLPFHEFRDTRHRWDPKSQRPELWNLYNARKNKGESIRVFPLSNWTELDIWQYIHRENIPIVPLYFADHRPIVWRDGQMIMVDDDRMRLLPGEKPELRKIRFRTLGCYPLTGAIESNAASLLDIIEEMLVATSSERQGRVIDKDQAASMEKKKQEGYF